MIGRYSVDFVNLRSETYTNDSRIPEMQFGTPLEDALRRDLTINSLYYNIKTMEVEDYSTKGIDDLKRRIVRTPLPALITLTDDPLRSLRAIRFACRLGFTIDEELASAISNPDVLQSLEQKVSRERVQIELELMMKSPSAMRAITLLFQKQLLSTILCIPFLTTLAPGGEKGRLLHGVPMKEFDHSSVGVALCAAKLISLMKNSSEASNNYTRKYFEGFKFEGDDWKVFMSVFQVYFISVVTLIL